MEMFMEGRSASNAGTSKRLLGKDFTREIDSFDGTEEKYTSWALKTKIAIKAESKKLFQIIEVSEKYDKEIDILKLETLFKESDGYLVDKWSA